MKRRPDVMLAEMFALYLKTKNFVNHIANTAAATNHFSGLSHVCIESLRRAPRRSGYGSGGRSQIRLLPIPRQ
jgi:hypothetical protein